MGYSHYRFAERYGSTGIHLYNEARERVARMNNDGGGGIEWWGGTTTGHSLYIRGTIADTYPYIRMIGASHVLLYLDTDKAFKIYENGTQTFGFDGSSIYQKERAAASPPTAAATYGTLWVADDDTLRYIDGAGGAHTIAFV